MHDTLTNASLMQHQRSEHLSCKSRTTAGMLFSIIKQSEQPISWGRRLKWCRQIVQAVASMHSKGFLVGSLGRGPASIFAVDGLDNALLYRQFGYTFPYQVSHSEKLPPEYHGKIHKGNHIISTPETDIYQLGLQLWQIAAHDNSGLRAPFCLEAGCTAGQLCTEIHASLIHLPPPTETPPYLVDIIAACRAENPAERPAATELLTMFPPFEGEQSSVDGLSHGVEKSLDSGGKINY